MSSKFDQYLVAQTLHEWKPSYKRPSLLSGRDADDGFKSKKATSAKISIPVPFLAETVGTRSAQSIYGQASSIREILFSGGSL